MKTVYVVVLTVILTSLLTGQSTGQTATAETACKLAIEDSPSLLGLKLGMTPQQAAEALGRDVDVRPVLTKLVITTTMKSGQIQREERSTTEPIGETQFTYYPRPDSNVGSLYLRFWRDRLYTFALDYEPRDFAWSHAKRDIEVITTKLGLPENNWRNSRLDCSDFYVKVSRPTSEIMVEVTDSKTAELIQQQAATAVTQQTREPDAKPVLKKDPGTPEYIPVLKNRYKVPVNP